MVFLRCAVFFVIIFLCTVFPANGADLFNEEDELLLFQDMDLVVSASRLKQDKSQLSVPVTVLSADDLHYGGHTSIPEALRYAPGVDVIEMDRNRYGVGIHGLEGLLSDRMMTLVDGMPSDSPAFGGPEFSSLSILMEDIERIEIVRGSGGGAWGANALSGVINIITKEPGSEPGLLLNSNITAFGDNTSELRYSETSGSWRWLFSGAYKNYKSSEEILDIATEKNVEDSQRSVLARTAVIYETESRMKISFGAGGSRSNLGAFETAGFMADKKNELYNGNAYLKASKQFSPNTEAYMRWAGRYQDMKRPSYGDVEYKVWEHDLEGQMTMDAFTDHSVAMGANLRSTVISSRPPEPGVFTMVTDEVHERWAGIFLSDRYNYSGQLAFEAQTRVDYFSEGDIDWSGRLSSIYGVDASMNHILRLSGAKSYRQPVGFIRNALFNSDHTSFTTIQHFFVDPELKSEQAWSLEGGYTWQLQENLSLKTDLYYMWYKNLIGGNVEYDIADIGVPEVFVEISNTGDARGYGAEVELSYEMEPLRVAVWYCYNDFEMEHEYQSIRSFLPAKHKMGTTLRYFFYENWIFNVQYAYTSDIREDVSDNYIESSDNLDLTISRKFFDDKGEIMIGVLDLLAKEYDPLVGLDQTYGTEIPGRTFFARVQYIF